MYPFLFPGVNADTFMDVLRNSAFHSKYFDFKLPQMQHRKYVPLNFDISGAKKDVDLITQQAAQLGLYILIFSLVPLFLSFCSIYLINMFLSSCLSNILILLGLDTSFLEGIQKVVTKAADMHKDDEADFAAVYDAINPPRQ